MAQSIAYRIGNSIGRLPTWSKVGIVVAALSWYMWPSGAPVVEAERKSSASTAASAKLAREAAEVQKVVTDCEISLPARRAEYSGLMKTGKFWDAALRLRSCAEALKSTELSQLVRDAEVKSHVADLTDSKKSVGERELAFERLTKDYPEEAAKHEQLAKRQIAAAARKAQESERKQKRSEGVRLGMSKDDVLASSWGKPQSINTTTNSYGTREQWVYGMRSYLYFENGVLTSIQN